MPQKTKKIQRKTKTDKEKTKTKKIEEKVCQISDKNDIQETNSNKLYLSMKVEGNNYAIDNKGFDKEAVKNITSSIFALRGQYGFGQNFIITIEKEKIL